MANKKQRKEEPQTEANFARDVEKATEPIMDRARQIKEEVSQATGEIKTRVDQNNETIRNKTEKLAEAGDKFVGEARQILRPESDTAATNFRERYGLRGRKLVGLLVGIVLLAILAVYGKGKGEQDRDPSLI